MTQISTGLAKESKSFLEQASLESTERFATHRTKAGKMTVETRDTPDPSLVSFMLAVPEVSHSLPPGELAYGLV